MHVFLPVRRHSYLAAPVKNSLKGAILKGTPDFLVVHGPQKFHHIRLLSVGKMGGTAS